MLTFFAEEQLLPWLSTSLSCAPADRPTSDILLTLPSIKDCLRRYSGPNAQQPELFDLHNITRSPLVFNFVVQWMSECCRRLGADVLVTVESGGGLFAGAVSSITQLPLAVIRKVDSSRSTGSTSCSKEPEPYVEIVTKESNVSGQHPTKLQLRRDSIFRSKEKSRRTNVVFLDDTISSGVTLEAALSLIRQVSLEEAVVVGAVFAMGFTRNMEAFPIITALNTTKMEAPIIDVLLRFPCH